MADFVDRPTDRRLGTRYPYDAIIETASNGKAVAIPMKAGSRSGVSSNLCAVLARRGYRAHTSYKDGMFYVWCEKL